MNALRPAAAAAVILGLVAVAPTGCRTASPPVSPPASAPASVAASAPAALEVLAHDVHSSAQPEQARVNHVDLDLAADFENRRLSGTAALTIDKAAGATTLIVDTADLDIRAVRDGAGQTLAFELRPPHPIRGTPLAVTLRPTTDRVVITYATRPEAGALQWLSPQLTATKKHPFLFSQGQSILTRSWIPTQDSPGVRQTYSAKITVDAPLRVVMSAEMLTPDGEPTPDGRRAFRFRMNEAIPPYLIAIAIGDLAFRALGPRTGVYAEPPTLDAAATELADTERMVEVAEKLFGPYRWGRYDMLVLPPSFPFGGMENPRLTFLTPTMLAGDRSLVSLIAHELAHSWSGNLVTNATWADFWLNEGFTTYIEYRIMEALYGPDRADMLARLGWSDLKKELSEMGESSPDTRLKIGLDDRNPDDGMTGIPYEKGAHFLRTVEVAVGREAFDRWLRSYFDRYAFKPMTTEKMLEDMRTHLLADHPNAEDSIGLEKWCYEPGIRPTPRSATPTPLRESRASPTPSSPTGVRGPYRSNRGRLKSNFTFSITCHASFPRAGCAPSIALLVCRPAAIAKCCSLGFS